MSEFVFNPGKDQQLSAQDISKLLALHTRDKLYGNEAAIEQISRYFFSCGFRLSNSFSELERFETYEDATGETPEPIDFPQLSNIALPRDVCEFQDWSNTACPTLSAILGIPGFEGSTSNEKYMVSTEVVKAIADKLCFLTRKALATDTLSAEHIEQAARHLWDYQIEENGEQIPYPLTTIAHEHFTARARGEAIVSAHQHFSTATQEPQIVLAWRKFLNELLAEYTTWINSALYPPEEDEVPYFSNRLETVILALAGVDRTRLHDQRKQGEQVIIHPWATI